MILFRDQTVGSTLAGEGTSSDHFYVSAGGHTYDCLATNPSNVANRIRLGGVSASSHSQKGLDPAVSLTKFDEQTLNMISAVSDDRDLSQRECGFLIKVNDEVSLRPDISKDSRFPENFGGNSCVERVPVEKKAVRSRQFAVPLGIKHGHIDLNTFITVKSSQDSKDMLFSMDLVTHDRFWTLQCGGRRRIYTVVQRNQ